MQTRNIRNPFRCFCSISRNTLKDERKITTDAPLEIRDCSCCFCSHCCQMPSRSHSLLLPTCYDITDIPMSEPALMLIQRKKVAEHAAAASPLVFVGGAREARSNASLRSATPPRFARMGLCLRWRRTALRAAPRFAQRG